MGKKKIVKLSDEQCAELEKGYCKGKNHISRLFGFSGSSLLLSTSSIISSRQNKFLGFLRKIKYVVKSGKIKLLICLTL
jgi:hypothetical protein